MGWREWWHSTASEDGFCRLDNCDGVSPLRLCEDGLGRGYNHSLRGGCVSSGASLETQKNYIVSLFIISHWK